MEKIKILELFSGYGTATFALKRLGIPHTIIGYSDTDKYANQIFQQNHGGKELGDCKNINLDELEDFNLLTGGFPCQDVSIAGKRDLSKNRTNLYLEVLKIAQIKKPQYMLLENVKGLLSMEIDEGKLINKIVRDLQGIGYGVCWKVLNSKDYGIPQNRERVWFVCKYGGWDFMEFQFPNKKPLKVFLKDILEKNVDKKFHLNKRQINRIIERNKKFDMKGNRMISDSNNSFSGLTCNPSQNDVLISNSSPRDFGLKKISPSLLARDYKEPKLVVHSLFPRSGNPKEGGVGHLSKTDGTSYCVDTGNCQCIEEEIVRRLTPTECFRLMGFLNDEINLDGISNTQKYKLAGNGQDVNIVSLIFKNMFKERQKKE